MRTDLKIAIVKCGKPQYQIAQELGIPESRLSKYLRGYGTLHPAQINKLHHTLGLEENKGTSRNEQSGTTVPSAEDRCCIHLHIGEAGGRVLPRPADTPARRPDAPQAAKCGPKGGRAHVA
jgi:transcriptional regulator with XRE-family HTH domain